MLIIIPIVVLTGLGALFGLSLAFASRKFLVATDPRLDEIFKCLPGVNCGSCGMPGCMGFAEGLLKNACTVDRCPVMEDSMRHQISRILGIAHKQRVKSVAVLHCHGGGSRAKDKYVYRGALDCKSAQMLMGGPKACVYGCIGYGTCEQICPFGAITMNHDGLPVVNEARCTACGKCVEACPKQLFTLVPVTKNYAVRCKSLEMGKKVMDACSAGCIGCRKCEKSCPLGAIKVIDNLAVIDYALCDNKGECYQVCPTKAIAKKEGHIWASRG